ncbi:MAG: invasin domain 3-containing protein, partial [Candidatus Zixiibacteriota bacterium]
LSPASGEIITSVPIHLDWEDEPCVIAYRLEYSTDEDFLPGSNITVSVDLGNTSNYDFQLSNIAARIYWRVYARDNEVESDPSQTWYFDYQPSINQEITSAIIASPPGQSQFEQNSTVATELRLTSTYSGPISGRWTIDGDDLAYISETVESFTSITITGPALPTSDLGAHTLGAIIESPNLISAPQINYEVVEPDVGVPHKISLSAMPAIVLADGISQALLTARVEDQNGILVTSDNGRVISFSLSGDGTLPAPPTAVTESGVAQLYYTSGTSPGTATVTVEATGLVSGQVEISLVANDLDGLLTEYDYIVDKLSSLKIYSLGGIPLINSYDQEEADEFVDTKIRPGSPTPEDLESFQRLLLSEKALLYGYHYIYDPQGPLSDPDRVRGADEMWDMGVRNIARSLLVGLGVKRLVDEFIKTIGKSGLLKKFFQGKIKEKLMAYINKKITKFVLDILFVAKNLVRDEQTRGRIDLLFPVIKESISGLLNQQVDLVQLSGEPVLRVAGDQFALATFHVERTQYDLDNAAYWADNNIHTGSL